MIIKRQWSDGRIENCEMMLLHEALMTANCETCFSFHSGNLWLLHLSWSSLQNCGLQWPTYYSIDSFSFDRGRFAHYGLLVKRKMHTLNNVENAQTCHIKWRRSNENVCAILVHDDFGCSINIYNDMWYLRYRKRFLFSSPTSDTQFTWLNFSHV